VGPEEASYLMDRPPGGWSDLVTNESLTVRLDALRHEMKRELTEGLAAVGARIERLDASVDRRLRAQTWITTTTMLAGLGLAFTAGRLA
jgi:hypothetical protein